MLCYWVLICGWIFWVLILDLKYFCSWLCYFVVAGCWGLLGLDSGLIGSIELRG